MAIILFFTLWASSWVPLFVIPFGTGGWYLMALVTGLLTAFIGWSGVSLQALSDNVHRSYYYVWAFVGTSAVLGTLMTVWSLVMLLWRGAGLHVAVTQN